LGKAHRAQREQEAIEAGLSWLSMQISGTHDNAVSPFAATAISR
jgi:hypothetical protein